MSTFVHFIDVGQGNMTLLRLQNGETLLYDCNVTDENEDYVIGYLSRYLARGAAVGTFINSHRDADHMRGVNKVHRRFPIRHVWCSGVTGTSPDCAEYEEYMDLRRKVGYRDIEARKYWDKGSCRLRVLNSKNPDLPDNANAQSIVIKVVHRRVSSAENLSSVMLTGDTDAVTWKDILRHYNTSDFSCSILLASHHGSLSFFDDPSDERNYYAEHIKAMSPAMTVISVGDRNVHGHPHDKSVELYEKYSTGSNKGNKIKRTDRHGSIVVELKDDGGWSMNQD